MPSGPGCSWPRVITMKFVGLLAMNNGSSAFSGMITVPPDFGTRSSPWSKNWPKNANIRLNGADRPKSGVMFGMNSAPVVGSGALDPEHTRPPEPHGFAAAATAAGLFGDWSTIRLLMMRGCASMTLPDFCVYDV